MTENTETTATNADSKSVKPTPKGRKLDVKDFLLAFLMPTIAGKVMVLYFGLNYSQYPDRGYGIGLILSLMFTLAMIVRFLWRYRHYDDS